MLERGPAKRLIVTELFSTFPAADSSDPRKRRPTELAISGYREWGRPRALPPVPREENLRLIDPMLAHGAGATLRNRFRTFASCRSASDFFHSSIAAASLPSL